MFNLLAGDAYCYFNRHYLILKFSECQCVLEGGCDCPADRVPDPVISFPRAPFSTAGTVAAPARLSIYAPVRPWKSKNCHVLLDVCARMQDLSRGRKCASEEQFFLPGSKFLQRTSSCERTSRKLLPPKNRFSPLIPFDES